MEMMKNAYGNYMRFSNEEVIACRTDKKMLEMLVENSYAFVADIAVSYYIGNEYTREDKIQIGFEGFLKAVKKFENDRGADFYTFAFQAVNSELNNTRKGMRRAKRGWDSENNSGTFVSSLDVAVGDATKAYKGKLGKYIRTILYVRPDQYIIIDDLAAKDSSGSKFEWWLNAFDARINVHDDGMGATIAGEKNADLNARIHYPENIVYDYINDKLLI